MIFIFFSLNEVYHLATFFSYNRRADRWSLKRGSMGAFTPQDVSNMDESPLALFGNQSKRSINGIGTPNEINGHISNKVEHTFTYKSTQVANIEPDFSIVLEILYCHPYSIWRRSTDGSRCTVQRERQRLCRRKRVMCQWCSCYIYTKGCNQ